MSKISYSSIEEVWGNEFSNLKNNKPELKYNTLFKNSNTIIDPNSHKQQQELHQREYLQQLSQQNSQPDNSQPDNSQPDNSQPDNSQQQGDFDKRKKIYVSNTLLNEATSVDNSYDFNNLQANNNFVYHRSANGLNSPSVTSGCKDYNEYYNHIINCDDCQAKFRKYFSTTHGGFNRSNSQDVIEAFSMSRNDSLYTDIICTILIGIFIIFILDFTVSFGQKWINKK
jgi:hypothetical protein